jgi:cytochrome c-type biogenesis protein
MAGGLLVGVALGLVWTPCAGLVFAAIAAVAATGDAGPRAFATLTAYALGAIVPLCVIAAGGRRLLGR